MLEALYKYASENNLIIPAGFIPKTIKAYICVTDGGEFLDIRMPENKKGDDVPCPDIGSSANGPEKCHPLAEKRSVVLGDTSAKKSAYFRYLLREGGKYEPMLQACLAALENPETVLAVNEKLDRLKIKGDDRISFFVNDDSILKSKNVKTWWLDFRKEIAAESSGGQSFCLITGEPTAPLRIGEKIQGLQTVGGHSSGDALICFDKDAFCSYGLEQGANAPVSEDAFAGVWSALYYLLKDAPILAEMKFVHWYDKPIPEDDDEFLKVFDAVAEEGDDDQEEEEEEERDPDIEKAKADKLINSVNTGKEAGRLASEYFIVLLSGAGGRVMIRHYERGSYQKLHAALSAWRSDLKLENKRGDNDVKPAGLSKRLTRLLTRRNNDRDAFKRLDKELSGLTAAVTRAILSGGELPDETAGRALAYIRSQMTNSDSKSKKQRIPDAGVQDFPAGRNSDSKSKKQRVPDDLACQWLKVWLLRRERATKQEETIKVGYNPNHPNPAYHCGALVAVYGAIQHAGMGEVNASVIDRYYSAASQTPALTMGQLQRLSNYHLGKIPWRNVRKKYEEMLNEVSDAIGDTIPVTLNLAEQAYFALGYRQKCSEIARKRRDDRLEREKKNAEHTENQDDKTGEDE